MFNHRVIFTILFMLRCDFLCFREFLKSCLMKNFQSCQPFYSSTSTFLSGFLVINVTYLRFLLCLNFPWYLASKRHCCSASKIRFWLGVVLTLTFVVFQRGSLTPFLQLVPGHFCRYISRRGLFASIVHISLPISSFFPLFFSPSFTSTRSYGHHKNTIPSALEFLKNCVPINNSPEKT